MDSSKASGLATSSLNIPKIKIHQSIPSSSIRKGPLAIVRSAALNDDINILRRFGSKPLFERDDITVNQLSVEDSHENITSRDRRNAYKAKNYRSSSTESSSPERYRYRETKKHCSPPSSSARRKTPEKSSRNENTRHNRKHNQNTKDNSHNKRTNENSDRKQEKSRSHPSSPARKKTSEKLPYYRDEQREKDRRRRLYGRSRSRTPPTTSSRRYSPQLSRRRVANSPSRRRRSSSSNKNYSSHHSTTNRYHKSRRSRTRSKSRTPSSKRDREHHKSHSSRERHKEQKDNLNDSTAPVAAPPPQIIPIAVPVPAADYAYTFPGWTATPQASWHAPHHRPPPGPPHYASFPMIPMMPPLRVGHRTPFAGLPPPYGPMPPGYRPHTGPRYNTPRQHSTHNYHTRPKKSSN